MFWKRLILVLLLLAVIFGGIFGWKYRQLQQMQAQMSQPQPPAAVAATTVEQEAWQPTLRAVGSLVAVNGVAVSTEVAGVVSGVAFESGETVERGDVLIRLDDSVDRAALTGLQADRELARVQFERTQDLLERRALSRSEFDEAKARFDAARAAVTEQRARIALKTIRAPFGGLLGLRRADLGEYLSPGARIVQLQALDPIYLDYAVPESQFNRLRVGQQVEARMDAVPGESFRGSISAIDSGIEAGTRTVTVRATLPNPEGALRPGMFAEVETLEGEPQPVLTVPRTAVSFNTYGDFAFLIAEGDDGELTVERRALTTGATRQGRVVVEDGLADGDRVVRAGLVKLRNGQRVTIDNSVELDDAQVTQP